MTPVKGEERPSDFTSIGMMATFVKSGQQYGELKILLSSF